MVLKKSLSIMPCQLANISFGNGMLEIILPVGR